MPDAESVPEKAAGSRNQRTVSVPRARPDPSVSKLALPVARPAEATLDRFAQFPENPAAAVNSGPGFAAVAQNTAPGAGTFVGLPPPSRLIGPLHLLPDGSIAVVPESSRAPPPHPPDHGLRPPPSVVPHQSGLAKRALGVVKPSAPPVIRNVDSGTPSAHAAPHGALVPPSSITIVSQIHNAPGWSPLILTTMPPAPIPASSTAPVGPLGTAAITAFCTASARSSAAAATRVSRKATTIRAGCLTHTNSPPPAPVPARRATVLAVPAPRSRMAPARGNTYRASTTSR